MSTSTSNRILFINISEVCRICLTESKSMRSIYSSLDTNEVLEADVCSFSDVLTRITNIPVSTTEDYPTLVCSDCVLLILAAYKFQMRFEHSHTILQQYLAAYHLKEADETNPVVGSPEVDLDTVVTESFLNSIEQVQNEQYGERQTSKDQIQKRQTSTKVFKKAKIKLNENIDNNSNNRSSLHPCPVCTKEFDALDLRAHAHTHKGLRKYLNIPTEHKVTATTRFYTKAEPTKTTVSLHNLKKKTHKCVACQLECSASYLRVHLQTHRNQSEYKCDQCQRVFKKLNHLNTHRVKHLKEYPFKCEQCGKGFVIKLNYECHILTHNANAVLPHECKFCLKRFSNPEHLNRHKIMHTENVSYSVKYRVCKCHHCFKTFKDRLDLKAHVCVPVEHAVNTTYPCKVCNKVFKNASGLYSHNRNIHELKGAKVLCSVCGHHVSNIYNHMMRHTGEKPYQCGECDKKFVGKPQLRQHLLIHSGIKPFVCSICAKAFNNLYNLQVHERIHKGDRCHVCNICKKGFLEKSYLKKHMNIHTKI